MENPELQPQTKLDKGQRIGVGLLICITALLIAVTFFQFKTNIFSYGQRVKTDGLANLDPGVKAEKEQDALKKADTDGDGLSDYDELFAYHSSPYMRDTDSDAIPDGEEVHRGTSPTCPAGKDCLFNPIAAAANASSTAPVSTSAPAPTAPAGGLDLTNISPQDLRDALIESGVPQDQLAGVSDADLMKLVQQAQQENSASQTTTPPSP